MRGPGIRRAAVSCKTKCCKTKRPRLVRAMGRLLISPPPSAAREQEYDPALKEEMARPCHVLGRGGRGCFRLVQPCFGRTFNTPVLNFLLIRMNFSGMSKWRKRMGVEPINDGIARRSPVLKTGTITGPHALPSKRKICHGFARILTDHNLSAERVAEVSVQICGRLIFCNPVTSAARRCGDTASASSIRWDTVSALLRWTRCRR